MYYVEYEGYLYDRKEDRYPQKGDYVVCVACHEELGENCFPRSRGHVGYVVSAVCDDCREDAEGHIKIIKERKECWEEVVDIHKDKIEYLKEYIKEQHAEGNYGAIFYGKEWYHRGEGKSYPIPFRIECESRKTMRLQRGAMDLRRKQ
jgi:hypothetical protein